MSDSDQIASTVTISRSAMSALDYAKAFFVAIVVLLIVCLFAYGTVWALTQFDASQAQSMINKEDFTKIRVGGNDFKVHEDLSDPEGAAKIMSNLNQTAQTLIFALNSKYLSGNGLDQIKPEFQDRVIKGIKDLADNYKTPNLEENIPERSGGDTSYVINKGHTFAMCLRAPEKNNELETNYNDLVFVLIHEMTHLFNETYGHDFMFWSNFKFMLTEAIAIGIYQQVDYKQIKSPYCGIKITYSPLYDLELPSYYKN